jgi:hypothetical protein
MNIRVGEWRRKSVEERLKLICQQAAQNYNRLFVQTRR